MDVTQFPQSWDSFGNIIYVDPTTGIAYNADGTPNVDAAATSVPTDITVNPTVDATATSSPTYGYSGVGSSPASGGGTEPAITLSDGTQVAAPPAGATQISSDGKSWLDALGKVVGAVAPIAVAAATPAINNFLSGGLLNQATGMITSSGNALSGITNPNLVALIPQLKLQVLQGQMTPAQAAAVLQGQSNMSNVETDAASLQGQREALARLNEISQNGGMTEADRAVQDAAMASAAAKAASDRKAQLQQLQMQGNAGSGAELAARLSGVQGEANANALAGAQTAQSAQARALAAIQASLSGNAALNTQQFNQAAQRAQAQDAINQFNAQAQNAMSQQNASNIQAANLANFNTANQIAGSNVGIQNQQAMLPMNTVQNEYNNALSLGKAQSAAQLSAGKYLGDLATAQLNRSANAAAATNAAIQGATQAGSTGGTSSGGSTLGTVLGAIPVVGGIANAVNSIPGAGTAISNAGSAIVNGIGNAANTVGGWISGSPATDTAATVTDTSGSIPTGDYSGYTTGQNSAVVDTGTPAVDTTSSPGILDSIGNAVSDAGTAISNGASDVWNTVSDWFSDENLKTDKKPMSDEDVDDLMAKMTAYKYRYKGSPTNPQQQGVMAQDMNKFGSVIDTPAGKMVQGPETMSKALAILANQHERIKKLEGK